MTDDVWKDEWTDAVEKALRKKTTGVEVKRKPPVHVGSLTLWSAGLTCLFRPPVLVFEPVHEQAVPGRAEHPKN